MDSTRAYVSAEDADVAACNVFTQRDSMIIRHFWSSEIGGRYQRSESGSPLHPDQAPLWTVLDTQAKGPIDTRTWKPPSGAAN